MTRFHLAQVNIGRVRAPLDDPIMEGFRKQLDTAVPMPNYAEMTLMWSPVTTAMNKIVKGSATPEVALKEAQDTVKGNIAKLRKGK